MRKIFLVSSMVMPLLFVSTLAFAKTEKGEHKGEQCESCHFQNQSAATSGSLVMAAETTATVNSHKTAAAIPETMKQQMISWLNQKNLPLPADPAISWSMSCTTCHVMHSSRAPYPSLLRYNMLNGEMCQLCHGGTINTAVNWTNPSSRRIIYAPSNPGNLQADGITEIAVPPAPKYDDVVSGMVNFPVAAFAGIHAARVTGDIAYRITIPDSTFGERVVNPASHMLWQFGPEMLTWDTTVEANGPYTVVITPFTPSTSVDATPTVLSVIVDNSVAPTP